MHFVQTDSTSCISGNKILVIVTVDILKIVFSGCIWTVSSMFSIVVRSSWLWLPVIFILWIREHTSRFVLTRMILHIWIMSPQMILWMTEAANRRKRLVISSYRRSVSINSIKFCQNYIFLFISKYLYFPAGVIFPSKNLPVV